MPKFSPGEPVEMAVDSVSLADSKSTALPQGTKGRVCHVYPFGYCCVQLAGKGCRRVHETKLRPASEPAPACTASCSNGCSYRG
jgi:hypothetical protein